MFQSMRYVKRTPYNQKGSRLYQATHNRQHNTWFTKAWRDFLVLSCIIGMKPQNWKTLSVGELAKMYIWFSRAPPLENMKGRTCGRHLNQKQKLNKARKILEAHKVLQNIWSIGMCVKVKQSLDVQNIILNILITMQKTVVTRQERKLYLKNTNTFKTLRSEVWLRQTDPTSVCKLRNVRWSPTEIPGFLRSGNNYMKQHSYIQ